VGTAADTEGMAQVHHTERPLESESPGCSMCASLRAAERSPEASPVGSARAGGLHPQGIHLHAAEVPSLVMCVTRLAATESVPVALRLGKALPSAQSICCRACTPMHTATVDSLTVARRGDCSPSWGGPSARLAASNTPPAAGRLATDRRSAPSANGSTPPGAPARAAAGCCRPRSGC